MRQWIAAAVLLALASPAAAYEYLATGFIVDLSDEFIVEPTWPAGDVTFAAALSRDPATWKDESNTTTICEVVYRGLPGLGEMTQNVLNTLVASGRTVPTTVQRLGLKDEPQNFAVFGKGDIVGIAFLRPQPISAGRNPIIVRMNSSNPSPSGTG